MPRRDAAPERRPFGPPPGRGRAPGGQGRGDRPWGAAGDRAWRSPQERSWGPPPDRPGRAGQPGPPDRPRWQAPQEVEPLGADEELVAGRRPVEEVFRAARRAIRLLVVPHRREALERIVLHATNLRIPIVEVEGGTLTSLAGFDGHQGVAVVVEPRRWAGLEDILARAIELGEPPFVLALDSLEDPHNVGTLLRSAEAAGVHGVIFPMHRQAPLTPSAVKASAGAVEHLLLCPVEDLAAALSDLHVRGLRIVGAEADAPLTTREADLRGPLAIVVGSEGQGLGPAVRRRVDVTMRIPMRGTIDSLNAAVAGSILVFEALAQRDPGGTSRPRPPRQPLPPAPEDPATTVEPAEPSDETPTPEPADPERAAETAPAADDAPAPAPAKPPIRPRRTGTKQATASEDAPPPASSAADEAGAPAPRRRASRARMGDATSPATPPAQDEPAAPTPKRRTTRPKVASEEPPADAAPPAKPRRRSPRAGSPGSEPAVSAPDADDDLLPGGPPGESGG